MKINFEDEVQVLLLLSSMADSWNKLVVSISNSAPDGKLTLEMVKNSMLNEEARKKEKGDATSSDAYVAESLCAFKDIKKLVAWCAWCEWRGVLPDCIPETICMVSVSS